MRSASLLFFSLITLFCSSQNLLLETDGIDRLKINYETIVKDYNAALTEGDQILKQLYASSYLSATIDSIEKKDAAIKLYISPGEQYKWLKLSKGNLDAEAESKIDISNRLFLNRPFNAKQLNQLFERAIKYYENNGYPFATVRLDSFNFNDNNELSASIKLAKNQFYKVDSVLLRGSSKISRKYLLNHLELKTGDPFNEEKIKNISQRIREIPFISETKKSEVQYFEKGVKIILHTKRKKASRFDGVLGLLSSADDGKIELTGDIDLNLINSFNRGEIIGLNWRKLKGNSQDLKLDLLYPYFFNTPFGIDFDFKLFKRDTTFIDLTTRAGLNYTFNRGELLTVFLENKSSSLLSRNSLVDLSSGSLPSIGDVSINSFGLNYSIRNYDYRYNPSKGFAISTTFAVGQKKLKKITALEKEYPDIYKNIDLSPTQYQGSIEAYYFIPIKSRSTIMLGNQSAIKIDDQQLYQNELLRIGGLKVLRGFDEESINASAYSIFTLEYRFLLDRNSYFSLFTDGAYYESKDVEGQSDFSDTPYSVGAGISFETAAGIFTFNYAVGKQLDNPIQFQAAKIHFGFVNFF